MRKQRLYVIAGLLTLLIALVLAGAGVARATPNSILVGFDGLGFGDPCADAFSDPLSATSTNTYMSSSTIAGGTAPECGLGGGFVAFASAAPLSLVGGSGSLDISVDGGAQSLAMRYGYRVFDAVPLSAPSGFAIGVGQIRIDFFRDGVWLSGDTLGEQSARYTSSPIGGFDEVIIAGHGYVDNLTFGFPVVAPCPDDRINCHLYDDKFALYSRTDDAGNPTIQVWPINSASEGHLMFSITEDDLGDYPANPPDMPVLVKSEGLFNIYVLPTGELQVNYGPDAEGKTFVIIMDDINGSNPHGYVVEP